MNQNLVIIRGAGDLATGVIQKFYRTNQNILVLESDKPTAIRRTVSLSDAVYHGVAQVEDMVCRHVTTEDAWRTCKDSGEIPLMVDPAGECIEKYRPIAVIDAIIAKKNIGTHRKMAPITIALGPGFTAGEDVDIVIETMRGHDLGRLLFSGQAYPNTGIPGEIGGKGALRVIHAPIDGVVHHRSSIGDAVTENQVLFLIGDTPIHAPFTGILRGLIGEGFFVKKGLKIADIDPRLDTDYKTISDKARCLAGAALEAYFILKNKIRV